MKANVNKNIRDKKSNYCVWMQCYDGDGNYIEEFAEDARVNHWPTEIAGHIVGDHDITLMVAPGDFVGVFAKNPQDIIDYVNGTYGTEGLKEMLGERTEDEKITATFRRLYKVSGGYASSI